MTYYAHAITNAVDDLGVTVGYLDSTAIAVVNKRRGDELRMPCCYYWVTKDRSQSETGIRSKSEAYRRAYYILILKKKPPSPLSQPRVKVKVKPPKLRLVA